MKFFLDSIFFSYSQIFFSNRRWFGMLSMIATFVVPQLGMMALFGVIISNLLAVWLKFDNDKIKSGFYGFNGILFGAATSFYFELNLFLFLIIPLFIIVTFFISAVLEHYLAEGFNLPGLSLPFVISVYIFIIFLTNYDNIESSSALLAGNELFSSFPRYAQNYFKSLALILFQPSVFSGIIIAIALLLFSRVLFILSITAFIFNAIFLHLILPEQSESLIIISSFNSILTSFALGGSLIISTRKSFLLTILSVVMVIIFTGFFYQLFIGGLLPILVLPFNFIVLATIYSLKFRKDQTDLTLLYFKPGSPEENFYYHQQRKSRFTRFKFISPELPFYGEWFVSQGFNGDITHKDDWKYAWDFVVVNDKELQYSNEGKQLSDYFCYELPVAAPLDGEVVKIVDGIPNNKIGEVNIAKNWGNTIILKHDFELYSSLSHLEENSIKIKEGDKVKKGDIIAACGNSGRSPYPHIHFQFQITDRLGEKTHKFPVAHYLVKKDDKFLLKTFDYPDESTIIQNLDVHKSIKNAFNFKYGDKLYFEYSKKGEKAAEEWEVKISMTNEMYLESTQQDKAYFYLSNKVFYFTSYDGKKESALYYFYLLAMQVPLCYQQNLFWEDTYSIAQLPSGFIRYFSEFFLLYKNMIHAKGYFTYSELPEDEKDFEMKNEIKIEGENLFSFYRKNLEGKLIISRTGIIKEFSFRSGDQVIIKVINSELRSS